MIRVFQRCPKQPSMAFCDVRHFVAEQEQPQGVQG